MRNISHVLATVAVAAIAVGVLAGPATAFPTMPSGGSEEVASTAGAEEAGADNLTKCLKKETYKEFRGCMHKAEPSGQTVDDDDYDAPGGY